jgi:phosphatidylethanolamine/phosphatidyl-N-methylethanolamine N-methyltransferase
MTIGLVSTATSATRPTGGRLREWLAFARAFAESPRTVGSIAPSSTALASRLCEAADLSEARVVIEIGPGTGAVTRHLLRCLLPGTRLVLVEISPDFAGRLRGEISSAEIVEGDAIHLSRIARRGHFDGADVVVSSLPLANLSPAKRMTILKEVRKTLRPGGRFVAYQYGVSVLSDVRAVFGNVEVCRVFRNLPPAIVYCCTARAKRPIRR